MGVPGPPQSPAPGPGEPQAWPGRARHRHTHSLPWPRSSTWQTRDLQEGDQYRDCRAPGTARHSQAQTQTQTHSLPWPRSSTWENQDLQGGVHTLTLTLTPTPTPTPTPTQPPHTLTPPIPSRALPPPHGAPGEPGAPFEPWHPLLSTPSWVKAPSPQPPEVRAPGDPKIIQPTVVFFFSKCGPAGGPGARSCRARPRPRKSGPKAPDPHPRIHPDRPPRAPSVPWGPLLSTPPGLKLRACAPWWYVPLVNLND